MVSAAITVSFPVLRSGSLQEYLDTASQIPILSKEEEVDLFLRFQEHDDLDAARKIVMSHLRYVIYVARGYSGYGLPLEDIIQQGNVGLMKSVKKFSLDHDVRLISFAVHWIKAEIHEYILRNWKIVKVATTKAQRKLFFNLRKAKKRLGWLSAEETKAVAEDLGVSEREVSEMEQRLYSHDVAFDPTPGDDEEKPYAPALYLPNPEPDPAAELEADDWNSQAGDALVEALEGLDERSRDILELRWLAEKKTTLHDLADKYGVSAERIRQIENNAIRKLRTVMVPA